MSLKENVLQQVYNTPGRTDRELTDVIRGRGLPQQPVNQVARQLEKEGRISRLRKRVDNLIGNYPRIGGPLVSGPVTQEQSDKVLRFDSTDDLSEDQIKKLLEAWLKSQGWRTTVAWNKTHGTDIIAERERERWVIEVKGSGSLSPMRVNYFLSILGEILQRMNDEKSHYSISLPDLKQFRNLWHRLPELAKKRTRISVIFVKKDGSIDEIH
ncbi:MAG: MarR family transcriptional regulator [bacterium]